MEWGGGFVLSVGFAILDGEGAKVWICSICIVYFLISFNNNKNPTTNNNNADILLKPLIEFHRLLPFSRLFHCESGLTGPADSNESIRMISMGIMLTTMKINEPIAIRLIPF